MERAMSPTSEHAYFRNLNLHPQVESSGQGETGQRGTLGGGSGVAGGPPTMEHFMGLSNQDLVRRYALGVEVFDRRVMELTAAQADTAFLPESGVGRWPVRVLLGHLADAEVVFVHRMRRTVAEENPLLAVFDEQAFIDSAMYGVVATEPGKPVAVAAHTPAIGGFIAVVHTLRKWTTEWLGSLSPKQWERGCLHPERGPQTVRKIAEYDTWHLEHHGWYLNRKVARFLGERLS
jgi:hypothetical protein